jgi:FKBP-type peptidyl-prolyl cis-trans isomerase SlyD
MGMGGMMPGMGGGDVDADDLEEALPDEDLEDADVDAEELADELDDAAED